jgi:hypothetical protein
MQFFTPLCTLCHGSITHQPLNDAHSDGSRRTERVFDRNLHSRMPFAHACSLQASRRVTNGILLGGPLCLPVHTVNYVQTLKGSIVQLPAAGTFEPLRAQYWSVGPTTIRSKAGNTGGYGAHFSQSKFLVLEGRNHFRCQLSDKACL